MYCCNIYFHLFSQLNETIETNDNPLLPSPPLSKVPAFASNRKRGRAPCVNIKKNKTVKTNDNPQLLLSDVPSCAKNEKNIIKKTVETNDNPLLPSPPLSKVPAFASNRKRGRAPCVNIKKNKTVKTNDNPQLLLSAVPSCAKNEKNIIKKTVETNRKELIRKVISASMAAKSNYQEEISFDKEVIDLENNVVAEPGSVTSMDFWIPELQLRNEDKDILCSSTEWLNDRLINAAQVLLKAVNSHLSGFQNTLLGQSLSFDIEPGEFVQILHDDQGHWFAVSSVGTAHPQINVLDSLYSSVSSSAKLQISALLFTTHKQITLSFRDVQRQVGSSDCGLFAIAFATAIAFGLDPGGILFDQQKLRQHLLDCFEKRGMTMFPIRRPRRAAGRVKHIDTIPVFCICRLPKYTNSNWVQCSKCKEWFHSGTCVSVPEELLKSRKSPWFCKKCIV